MSSGAILYPQVSSVPARGVSPNEEASHRRKVPGQVNAPAEFEQVFDRALGESGKPDLTQVQSPLKFSAHATQRLQDRKIRMDAETMSRVRDAVEKADAKGVEDTLILTSDAALIVSVKNRTVVTAMDRNSLSGNVFTNIDGAVIV